MSIVSDKVFFCCRLSGFLFLLELLIGRTVHNKIKNLMLVAVSRLFF